MTLQLPPFRLQVGHSFWLSGEEHEIVGHKRQGHAGTTVWTRITGVPNSRITHDLTDLLLNPERRAHRAVPGELEQRSRWLRQLDMLDKEGRKQVGTTLHHTLQVMYGDLDDPRYFPTRENNQEARIRTKYAEMGGEGSGWGRSQQFVRMNRLQLFGPAGLISGHKSRETPSRVMTPEVCRVIAETFKALRAESYDQGQKVVEARRILKRSKADGGFGYRERQDTTADPRSPVLPGYSTMQKYAAQHYPGTLGEGGTIGSRQDQDETPLAKGRLGDADVQVGEILEVDTSHMSVLVVIPGGEGAYAAANIIAGMDRRSRSICGFDVVIGSDDGASVGNVIVDSYLPKPLPAHLGTQHRWSHPDLSERTLADGYLGGASVANWPYFHFETVVYDGGPTYDNYTIRHVVYEVAGSPHRCHVRTPEEKGRIERAFRSFWTLLFKRLDGNTGGGPKNRRKDAHGRAIYTVEELRDLVRDFIITVWQNRELDIEEAFYAIDEKQSPNRIVGYGVVQGDFVPTLPDPYLRIRAMLPHSARFSAAGLTANGRTYYGGVIQQLHERDPLPGSKASSSTRYWIRIHGNDPHTAWLQLDNDWHQLRYVNAPDEYTYGDGNSEAAERFRESSPTPLDEEQVKEEGSKLVAARQGEALFLNEEGRVVAHPARARRNKPKPPSNKQREANKAAIEAERDRTRLESAQRQVQAAVTAGAHLSPAYAPGTAPQQAPPPTASTRLGSSTKPDGTHGVIADLERDLAAVAALFPEEGS